MELYPLQFAPLFRSYIWGGRRLGEKLGKPIGHLERYAESWEIVDHGDDQSCVTTGPLAGKTLHELITEMPQWMMGSAWSEGGAELVHFPLLLKYLDCQRVLSVQVHPDDHYAKAMNPPDLGKTEAWYVIDAAPGSVIYAGLRHGVDRETFATAIHTGRVADVLNVISPRVGDCIFIPAGTVHALGAGIMVAEIQQSSDTTFRVFDWNRLGDDGRPRALHIDQALEVTQYTAPPVLPQVPEKLSDLGERLVECDKFILDRYMGTQPTFLPSGQCRILTVVAGGGTLRWPQGEIRMPLGHTVLIPAILEGCEFIPLGSGATLLSAIAVKP